MKVKKILVSQPAPASDKSPFSELTTKHKVEIDFRPFITVQGVTAKEFRAQRVDIPSYTAVIFTSRTTIDHYFRVCEECRIPIAEDMKYFCTTEAIALYLQKYIVYRKRKIFYGKATFVDLMEVIHKHKTEKYLVALSEPHKPEIPELLTQSGVKFTKVILSHTVPTDLSDVVIDHYDMIACYSSADIKALRNSFSEIPGKTIFATLGNATAREAIASGIDVHIMAPTPKYPSLTMAMDKYITALRAGNSVEEFGAKNVTPAASVANGKPAPAKKSASVAKTTGVCAKTKKTTRGQSPAE